MMNERPQDLKTSSSFSFSFSFFSSFSLCQQEDVCPRCEHPEGFCEDVGRSPWCH